MLVDQMPSTLLKVKDFRRSKEENSLEVCDWNEYAILIFMKQMWPQTSEFANFVEICGEKVFLAHWKDWRDSVPKKFFKSLLLLIVIYEDEFSNKNPGNGTVTARKFIYLKNTVQNLCGTEAGQFFWGGGNQRIFVARWVENMRG